MSFYFIIRGPLGAGKSTISAEVAKAVGGRHIFIDAILEEHNLEEWDQGYISERSFLRANELAAQEARVLLDRGTSVVFDGNFYYRSVVEDLETRLPFPHRTVTLRAPLPVCVARDAGRTPSYGPEAAREVFEKTTAFDYGTVIDAVGPVPVVVRRVLELLPERRRPGSRTL